MSVYPHVILFWWSLIPCDFVVSGVYHKGLCLFEDESSSQEIRHWRLHAPLPAPAVRPAGVCLVDRTATSHPGPSACWGLVGNKGFFEGHTGFLGIRDKKMETTL